MTPEERVVITDLSKCNFNEINEHFKRESEAKKNRTKEEKQVCADWCEKSITIWLHDKLWAGCSHLELPPAATVLLENK